MTVETVSLALLLFGGLWLLVYGTYKTSLRGGGAIGLALVAGTIALAAGVLTSESRPVPEREVRGRPISVRGDGYVSSSTCRACHPDQYASWHASYHRTMTQVATTESVVGDFQNIDPLLADYLYQRGDQYFVRFRGPSAAMTTESPIVMTTGSHHYQAYWYEAGQGRRLKLVPALYLIEEQRWIPRDAAFLTPPATSAATLVGEWNANCIKCHTTHGQPRVSDAMARSEDVILDTHVSEFGISCESCHGPAEAHVEANQNPVRRYIEHLQDGADPTIVQPARLDHKLSSEICGQCHSVFEHFSTADILEYSREGFKYRPGENLDATRNVVRPSVDANVRMLSESVHDASEYIAQRFWSDGMVRVSGREYNGLVESPCYQHGDMSCLSCHEMHKAVDDPRSLKEWANDQLKPAMDSNQACLQCHAEFTERLAEHTHHAATSAGSLCYNCHMPYTTFGLLKAIRSHQIDSPSVQSTLATGRPNACNLCHLDKTLAWTADHLTDWYGAPPVELNDDQRTVAASVLWALQGDAGQRALVAWSFGWQPAQAAAGTEWMAAYLAELINDPYDAVRFVAHRSLKSLPGFGQFEYDFMAPAAGRAAAQSRTRDLWQRQAPAKSTNAPPEVLLDAAGAVDQPKYERLLHSRDMRPINLAE